MRTVLALLLAAVGLESEKAIRSTVRSIEGPTHLVDDEGTLWQMASPVDPRPLPREKENR